jgi:hypothetical protein
MINWAVVGHRIPAGHWYYDDKEGGRVLGNLCHWTDLTLHLVNVTNAFPCTIVPATPPGEVSDCVVSFLFADRSCAAITFSAKADTFEGVREVLNLQKGNALANLTDFQTLTVDVIEKRSKARLWHRDHGHEANILHSWAGAADEGVPGEEHSYIAATAKFFLATRQAVDEGVQVTLSLSDITGGRA